MRPGDRIGSYEVVGQLGRGGMGAVFEVRHPQRPGTFALKLIEGVADAEGQLRFARECEALARIRHRNVVAVLEVGRTPEGAPYLVMERVQGETLDPRAGALEPRKAASIARDLADALSALHRAEIVHRDVKPSNVVVREDGSAVLIDFGLARAATDERLTATGAILGTPGYLSPEQALGEKAGPAADIYGLGATLYAFLTGRAPFSGGVTASLYSTIQEDPPWPRELVPQVPEALDALCRRAMSKAPGSRPDAAEVRDAIDAWSRGDISSRRSRALPLVAAMTLLALLGAIALRMRDGAPDVHPVESDDEEDVDLASPSSASTAAESTAPTQRAPAPWWTIPPPPGLGAGGHGAWARFLDDRHVLRHARNSPHVQLWEVGGERQDAMTLPTPTSGHAAGVLRVGSSRRVVVGHLDDLLAAEVILQADGRLRFGTPSLLWSVPGDAKASRRDKAGQDPDILSLDVRKDGLAAVGGEWDEVFLVDLLRDPPLLVARLPDHGTGTRALAFGGPSGSWLHVGIGSELYGPGGFKVWDLADLNALRVRPLELPPRPHSVWGLAVEPDNPRRVAFICGGAPKGPPGLLVLVNGLGDAPRERPTIATGSHAGMGRGCAFLRDRPVLLSIANQGHDSLRGWSADDGAPLFSAELPTSPGSLPFSIEVSPDGQQVAIGYTDGHVDLLHTADLPP